MIQKRSSTSKQMEANLDWGTSSTKKEMVPQPPPVPPEKETEEEKKFRQRSLGRRIIQVGATGFTSGQQNRSIFEIKLLAVCWSLEHEILLLECPHN